MISFDIHSEKHLNFYENIIRNGARNAIYPTSSCTLLLYYFNYTTINIRNLDGHKKVPVRILNLVSLMFRFHTLNALNRPSNTMTVNACAAPSPLNLLAMSYFVIRLNVYK